ncbi:hypothetical protein JOL79_20010 [Microbispora sp. RL4-1S]|uniref:Uncharacterized protein n=1 Tax=Microbispora oryzae TaxID=2806554 RepID=A0A940WLI9_9ACTN|nr:hypothetical protein [Microbispora oryzae]MBP2706097.1 hypothetical protein [Microbispora oryzae]
MTSRLRRVWKTLRRPRNLAVLAAAFTLAVVAALVLPDSLVTGAMTVIAAVAVFAIDRGERL